MERIYDEHAKEDKTLKIFQCKVNPLRFFKKWQHYKLNRKIRNNIVFFIHIFCSQKVYKFSLNCGSNKTIFSKVVVESWFCPLKSILFNYKIAWFWKKKKVLVTTHCLMKFTMGDAINNEAWWDVVPSLSHSIRRTMAIWQRHGSWH